MKNKYLKKVFSVVLSLLLTCNVSTLVHAADTMSLSDATADFNFDISNSGINKGDTVTAKAYVTFSSEYSGEVLVASLQEDIEYDTASLTFVKFEPDSAVSALKNASNSFSTYYQIALSKQSDVSFPVNTKIALGTITFNLKSQKKENEEIKLTIKDSSKIMNGNVETPKKGNITTFTHKLTTCSHTNKVKTAAKEATCTEDGNSEYWTCQDCGKISSTEDFSDDITLESTKISALEHDFEEVEAKDATCTEDGNSKYYRCKRCGELFSDAEGTTPTTLSAVTTPASGHSWDAGEVTKEPTYLADGERTYTCTACGETKTEAISKLTHDDKNAGVQYWGEKVNYSGHEMYVDADGKTSALVTGNEKIWLREESYDPAAGENLATWYMIDNTSGEFEAGSRFWVKWLNNKDNPIEFLEHFNNIDQTIRDRIDSNKVWIFLIGVTKPDGTTEYKTLNKELPVYIQMGTDWDYKDIKAIFISNADDEEVYASYLDMEGPEGMDEFAKLSLKHFSPYAIYDYLTDAEKAEFDKLSDAEKAKVDESAKELIAKQEEASNSSSSNNVKTGDESGYISLSSILLFVVAGLYISFYAKKRKIF